MRILYIIDSLVPSGAERSLAALAPEYVKRGVQLDIAYLAGDPVLEPDLVACGANVFSLAGPGSRLRAAERAAAIVRSRRSELIHTVLFEADLVGRAASLLTGVPVATSLVNPAYGARQLRDPQIRRSRLRAAQSLDALTARRVVRFHAVSQFVARTMGRRLALGGKPIDVIPRGRDPKSLGKRTVERRLAVRRELGIAADAPLVLSVARHEYQKGLDVLIESFAWVVGRLPDAKLLIAGREGNQTGQLQRLIAERRLGKAVTLLGTREDVPDLLATADAVVLASRWEGLGGAIVEAMALEAPVVVSDFPSLREVVPSDEVGHLVPSGSASGFAEAIVATILERDESARRAVRARQRFEKLFTTDHVGAQMVAFSERALGLSALPEEHAGRVAEVSVS